MNKDFELKLDSFDISVINYFVKSNEITEEFFPLPAKLLFGKKFSDIHYSIGLKKQGHIKLPEDILNKAKDYNRRRIDVFLKNQKILLIEKY